MNARWLSIFVVAALALAALPASGQTSTQTDLALDSVEPGDPAVEARRSIAAVVENVGDGPVVQFSVTFYWGDTDTPVNGTEQDSTASYNAGPLNPGETARLTFDWKPTTEHAGSGHLVAVVNHEDDANADNDRGEHATFVTEPGVHVDPSWGSDVIEIEPGSPTGLAFHVQNTGNRNATMKPRLSTPEDLDWSFEVSPTASRLLPGEQTRFVLTVEAPEDAPAGQAANETNGLDLEVRQQDYTDSSLGRDRPVPPDLQVAEQREISLALEQPELRSPGETVSANVTVENHGNREEDVTLERSGASNETTKAWNVSFSRESLSIPAGESAQTTVEIELPLDASAGSHELAILAAAQEEPSPPSTQASLDVDVRQIHRVDASLGSENLELLPDQQGSVELLVSNEGNGLDEIEVATEPRGPSWKVQPSPGTLELAAGEQAAVEVRVRPPVAHPPEDGIQLPVEAASTQADDANASRTLTLNVTEGAYLHLDHLPSTTKVHPDVGASIDTSIVNGGNRQGNGTFALEAPEGWEASANLGEVSNLAPGASRGISLTIAPPEGASPGQEAELETRLRTTPGGPEILESSLARVGGPDWTVEVGSLPGRVATGDTIEVPVHVASEGLQAAPGTKVELTAIGDGGRTTIQTWTIEETPAGETQELTARWNTTDVTGTVGLTATVDPADEVAEESETNNEARDEVRVTFVDLAVRTPAPRLVDANRTIQTGGGDPIVVINRGNRPAQARVNLTDEAGWIDRELDVQVPADGRTPIDTDLHVPEPAGRVTNNLTVGVEAGPATASAQWPLTVRDPAPPTVTGIDTDTDPEWGLGTNLTLLWEDSTGLAGGHVRITTADDRSQELDVRLEDGQAIVYWTPRAVGNHTIVPVLEDLAGNSAPGLPRDVHVAPPPAPSVGLAEQGPVAPGTLVPVDADTRPPVEQLVVRREGVNQTLPAPHRIDTTGWSEGEHELELFLDDALGRHAEAQATLEIDATPPQLESVELDPSKPRPGDEVTVQLSFDEPVASATITFGEDETVPERVDTTRVSDTEREATLTLPDQPVDVNVEATDRAGNAEVFASVHETTGPQGIPAAGWALALTGLALAARARRRT